MKKSKILLPLVGIAGVAAVAAPLVSLTSCGVSKTFQIIKDDKGVKFERSTTPLAEGTTFAGDLELNKAYMDASNKNPTIICDDLLAQFAAHTDQTIAWGCKNMTMTVVNPTVKVAFYFQELEPAYAYPVLLWNFTIKGTWEWYVEKGKAETYLADYEFNYNNVVMSWAFNSGKPEMSPLSTLAQETDHFNLAFGSSITYKQGVHMDDQVVWNTYVLDNSNKFYIFKDYHKYEFQVYMYNFKVDPGYLANVTQAQ